MSGREKTPQPFFHQKKEQTIPQILNLWYIYLQFTTQTNQMSVKKQVSGLTVKSQFSQ